MTTGGYHDYAYRFSLDGGLSWRYCDNFPEGTSNNYNFASTGDLSVFVPPHVVWANRAGGTSEDRGYGIAVDNSGNIYSTGWFKATSEFDETTHTSAGHWDLFLSKYIP